MKSAYKASLIKSAAMGVNGCKALFHCDTIVISFFNRGRR